MFTPVLLGALLMQSPPHIARPVPSARQLAWHDLGHYAFVHFGPNTFTGKEWGEGLEDPKVFAPTALDTDQWCRTFKEAGMSMVVVTAKHHDGFCLWPSKHSNHTVRESGWKGGKGDVLRELSRSCEKHGLKFGVYLSPWDRNHPAYGTEAYNDVFVGMLREVLTGYGEVSEVWFDGANGEGPNGKRQVYDWPRYVATVRELAPLACIFSDAGPDVRWAGNEQGTIAETNWHTIDNSKHSPGRADTALLQTGQADGPDWIPGECDVSIRPGWFWRAGENGRVKTADELMGIYLASVGRGANLILNVPPDTRGLIHENDARVLRTFGKLLRARYGRAVSTHKPDFQSGSGPVDPRSIATADKALKDRDLSTFVASQSPGVIRTNIIFDTPTMVDAVEVCEPIGQGQSVSRFEVVVDSEVVAKGTTIGRRRIVTFEPRMAQAVHVSAYAEKGTARLAELRAFSGPRAVAKQLSELVRNDQAARQAVTDAMQRGKLAQDDPALKWVHESDRASTQFMRQFFAERDYPLRSVYGDAAESDAWLLVQHADADPKFQARYLAAMGKALALGEAAPSRFAYLTDRVLRSQGKPQRYGTQCSLENGKAVVQEVEDPKGLDARRAKLGLEPIAAYLLFVEQAYSSHPPQERPKDERMQWWREARFGMFVHWGLYAIPAGQWKGKDYPGASEWLIHHADIPPEDWFPLAEKWDPVKFDARAWVRAAKQAGMKYIVITSKHHEGFALWPSAVSEFDVETTPNKTDILAALKKACDDEGIKFGLYHSILDWTHKDYLPKRSPDKRPPGDFTAYVGYMKAQLHELVTRYDPAILWFDGEWDASWTHELGLELEAYLRALKPDLIINNRIDRGRSGMAGMTEEGFAGDFGTPEQEIPSRGFPGVDWESCMTMNGSWGYDANDSNWKSAKTLVENLVDCASKGGNYLLNVGPKADGTIPAESLERMSQVGRWLDQYGEAVYGTSAGPLPRQAAWGRVTSKPGKLYVVVFDGNAKEVTLSGVRAMVTRIYPLSGASEAGSLMYRPDDAGLTIPVPDSAADPLARVLVIEHEGPVEVTPVRMRPGADGTLTVPADEWNVHGTARYEGDKRCIGFWTSLQTTLDIEVEGLADGLYDVEVEWACAAGSEGSEVEFAVGGSAVRWKVPSTHGWDRFESATLGSVKVEGGATKIAVIPRAMPSGAVMNLRRLTLRVVP
ncbi:MAG: alpha-L-fucosidase [Fimbriimonadaceae bacterium]